MTETETKALLQRYFDAFNASDFSAMTELVHEDVAHDPNQGERRIGRESFHTFLVETGRLYEERLADISILAGADGTRASAEVTVHGHYRTTADGFPEATGQSYSLPAGLFFDVDDGLITRVTTYYNVDEWTRQIGLDR